MNANTHYISTSAKKIYATPSYSHSAHRHYVLDDREKESHLCTSPCKKEYVIVLDSPHHNRQEFIETNTLDYSKDAFYESKLQEFQRTYNLEIEEMKSKALSECKIIIERELRAQANSFLIEKESLEHIIKEQQSTLVEYEIKFKTYSSELETLREALIEKEKSITNLNIEILSIKQGEEQTIYDLRLHYEEMLKLQEEKFKQELEEQINILKASYESRLKVAEQRAESLEARIIQLNKTIESLNMALLERTNEINSLQKSLQEAEYRHSLQETSLRQEHERILINLRREYEEKLRSLELKVQKFESSYYEIKRENERLVDEIENWKKKYYELEKVKQKEIVKEVLIEKPIKIKEKQSFDTRIYEEKALLMEEVQRLKTYIGDLELRLGQSEQIIILKDQEIQRMYLSIEELQISLKEIQTEVEKVREENTLIIRDREKLVQMINSYRRYLKELEIFVSDKNKDLFQKIKNLENIMISREEFMIDFDINPVSHSDVLFSNVHKISNYTTPKTEKMMKTITTNKKISQKY